MSSSEIMDRLEVQLPEDIFKDLVEPGKTFQRDVCTGRDDSEKSERPRISLRLEKMADSLVKLFITTYKQDDLSNTSMQTEQIDTEHCSIQTDVKKTGSSDSQTDKSGTEESAMQTEKKQEKAQQQQTELKSGTHKLQQTDVKEEKDQHQQTEVKAGNHKQQQTDVKGEKDQHQQTVIKEYHDSQSQTKHKIFTNTECQTVSKEIVEQDCQTDIAEVKSHLSQTDLSMSNLVDGCTQHELEVTTAGCQAVASTGEREIQATVLSIDSTVQTFIDTKSAAAQAVIEMGTVVLQTELSMFNYTEMCCQTELDLTTQDCQTDYSMANLQESEVQAVVSNSEISQQTEELEKAVGCIQTDYLGENIETQTVPDVNNMETQTEPVVVESVPEIQEAVPDDMAQPPIIDNLDSEQIVNASPICEMGSQTDPVTIIIGDASFLVQRLKSASVNPAKVTGNEIEIEVRDGLEITQNGGPEMCDTMSSPSTPQRLTPKAKVTPKVTPAATVGGSPGMQHSQGKRTGRPRKLTQTQIDLEKRQVVGVKQPYVPKPIDVVSASYSCPFCDMIFHESPTLYEHITINHNDAMVKGHKKPKGREGKTIVPRSVGGQQLGSPPYLTPQAVATVGGNTDQYGRGVNEEVVEQLEQVEVMSQDVEVGPPILEPEYTVPKQTYTKTVAKKASKTYSRNVQQPQPSLFEDLPEPTRSYPRNRVKREGNEQDDEEDSNPGQPQIDAYEYECPHCPEKYGSASHLYTHLKRSHKTDLEKNKPIEKAQEDMIKQLESAGTPSSGDGKSAEGTPVRKRKRVSVATPQQAVVEEPVKKQKMSEDGDEEDEDEIPGPEDEEGLPVQSELQGEEEEGEEGECGQEEEEVMEETGIEEENAIDEIGEEATEETSVTEEQQLLPEIKAPTRKTGPNKDTSTEDTTPAIKRRGRPPKGAKKGGAAASPAVVVGSEGSPRISGRSKRT